MKNLKTNDNLIKELLSPQEQQELYKEIEKEINTWGGARKNSGRKAHDKSKVLKFTKRLSEKEKEFIDYARAHNINYDDLMQG